MGNCQCSCDNLRAQLEIAEKARESWFNAYCEAKRQADKLEIQLAIAQDYVGHKYAGVEVHAPESLL